MSGKYSQEYPILPTLTISDAETEIRRREAQMVADPKPFCADKDLLETCFFRPHRFATLMHRTFPDRDDCRIRSNEVVTIINRQPVINLEARYRRYETDFVKFPYMDTEIKLVVKEFIAAPLLIVHPLTRRTENSRHMRPVIQFESRFTQNLTPWQRLGHIHGPEKIERILTVTTVEKDAIKREKMRDETGVEPVKNDDDMGYDEAWDEASESLKQVRIDLAASWKTLDDLHEPAFNWLGLWGRNKLSFNPNGPQLSGDVMYRVFHTNWDQRRLNDLYVASLFIPEIFPKILLDDISDRYDSFPFVRFAEQAIYLYCCGAGSPRLYRKLSSYVAQRELCSAFHRFVEYDKSMKPDHIFRTETRRIPLYRRIEADPKTRLQKLPGVEDPRGFDRILEVSHCQIQMEWNVFLAREIEASFEYRRAMDEESVRMKETVRILAACPDHPIQLEAAIRRCRTLFYADGATVELCFTLIRDSVEDAFKILAILPEDHQDGRNAGQALREAKSLTRALELAHKIHRWIPLAIAQCHTEPRPCFPLIPSFESLKDLWIPTTADLEAIGTLAGNCLRTYSAAAARDPIWFFRDELAVGMIETLNHRVHLRECLDAHNRITPRSTALAAKINEALNGDPDNIRHEIAAAERKLERPRKRASASG